MLITKEDMPIVAMEFMNDVHSEDVEIINELFDLILSYENNTKSETKDIINKKYKEWILHTIDHFKGEEVMMEERNFPPYLFHKGEHDKALEIMNDVFNKWNQTDDIQILKQYFIEELPVWFTQHIQSMDTVTAMFFKTGLSPCAMK